ncbi:MAG: molybdopterin-binding protein [Helicobacter sp.]|nr:molybdopterin-binding protein [Helicobacter sp.]
MSNLKKQDLLNLGILTISDRAFDGIYADRSGGVIEEYFKNKLDCEIHINYKLINDSKDSIISHLKELSNTCDLVVSTGGTGIAQRDFTSLAMLEVCDKMMLGFGEAMRESARSNPLAILSNQSAGVRGKSLLISLPGSPKAVIESLDAIILALPHAIYLLTNKHISLKDTELKESNELKNPDSH